MPDLIQRLKDAELPTKIYEIDGYYCEICQKWHRRIIEKIVGKDAYFTREAAEAALKERESDG